MSEVNSHSMLIRARELAATGQMDKARSLAESACEADIHNTDGWLLLGNINGQLQAFDDAIESFGRAARLAPAEPRAHACLANALYAAGRLDDAVAACRRALEIQPDNANNWYLLATIYALLGNPDESATCLRRVIQLAPTNAKANRSLGYILQTQYRLEEALESYKRAVGCNPDFAEAYNDIGVVLQELGRTTEAVRQYRAALRIRPHFLQAMVNLGSLLLTQYQLDAAQGYFEAAAAIDKDNPKVLCGLGSVLLERGQTEEAYARFRTALSLDPAYEEASVYMARLHERKGNYDEALFLLQPLMEKDANTDAITAFALLSPHFHLEDKAVELLERSLDNGRRSTAQTMAMHFSLGRLYDRKGEYDLAYLNFRKDNELKHAKFRASDHARFVDSLISTYSRENLSRLATGTPTDRQPVFIVGMPRSGTSLAEQILSVHPDVQAAGELTAINRIAALMHETLQTGRPYPEGALNLVPDNIEGFAQDYLAGLPAEGAEKPFFTDKMPHNFLHLGLIQQLFPEARVIHCTRDARDTCFSCYSYDFNGEHSYAYELEALGKYYLQYQRLMKHWQSVLSLPVYQLDYEQLIADQEQEIHNLVTFCGLEWNDVCLEYHKSRRIVLTSSYSQVCRPIYNSSIGRWKHYEKYIQPLLNILRT